MWHRIRRESIVLVDVSLLLNIWAAFTFTCVSLLCYFSRPGFIRTVISALINKKKRKSISFLLISLSALFLVFFFSFSFCLFLCCDFFFLRRGGEGYFSGCSYPRANSCAELLKDEEVSKWMLAFDVNRLYAWCSFSFPPFILA